MSGFSEPIFAVWLQKIGSFWRQEMIDLAFSSDFGENTAFEKRSLLIIPIILSIHLWKTA